MSYRVVSDNLRGDPLPEKPIVWPDDLAKTIEKLLAGKTLFISDAEGDDPSDVAVDISRIYQLVSRKAGKRLSRSRRTYKGEEGWVVWLNDA